MERLTKDWLAKSLSKYENRTQDDHRWGKVEAVNADGSYMVRIGDGEPARCSNGCVANVGDVVFTVVTKDGLCVAMCRLGGDLGGGGTVTYKADDVSNYIAGRVFAYAGADEPMGSLPCDGRAVSRSEYWELFAAIGTTYGEGDGSTTFNLPNIASRTIVGESEDYALGETGGEETHTLTVEEMPSHNHRAQKWNTSGTNTGYLAKTETGNTPWSYSLVTDYVGGSQPHNNMQPYIVLRYLITTGKGDATYGKDGTTFTPSVSEDGVLSWTNDGGAPNPASVNIAAAAAELVEMPTKVSAFENDVGYLTSGSMDSIAEYVMSVLRQNGLAPRIDFGSGTLYAAGAAAYYTPVSITDSSVNFYYYGASGVEQILYQITGLTPGCTYRINFSETYTGTFIGDTYQYGCGVLQESEYAATTFPITSGSSSYIKWVAAATPGTQSGSLTFTAKTNKAWWMWYMVRLSDGSRQNITFKGTIEVL